MRKTAISLMGAVILLCCAGFAGAADKYPPGPGGTCPDSVTIARIQDATLSCHPALLDTVLGVAGIVSGFDAVPSAFGFYLQNRGQSSFAGIDIFTGSTNYNASPFSLALGDSVVVYGRVQEFPVSDGTTEIEGPDGTQSTNDIIVRKVSSGNSLPAILSLTTTSLNMKPTALNPAIANQEQWEGMLVKVSNTPLVVRRIDQGSGDDVPFGCVIATAKTGAQDSVMIDFNTLGGLGNSSPTVGTQITFVQGILNQGVTGAKSTFRIQIRGSSDVTTAAPPQLVSAYPIAPNIIRVLFDRSVTNASATNTGNYSMSSLRGVLGASQFASNEVRLTIDVSSPYTDGETDGLTVVGVISSATPDTMKTPDSNSFVGGLVEPKSVQIADATPLSGSPCEDRSRFAGTGTALGSLWVSVEGVAVAKFGSTYYLDGSSGGQRNGLAVFGPATPPTIGHKWIIVGNVQEFGSGPQNGRETELAGTAFEVDEGVAAAPAAQAVRLSEARDTTCDVAGNQTTGEDYEGVLVQLTHARVIEQRTNGQSFLINGCCGGVFPDTNITLLVANSGGNSFTVTPDSAHTVNVTGILTSNSLASPPSLRYRLQPRSDADIQDLGLNAGVLTGPPGALSFSIAPNPARTPRFSFALPKEADVDLSVYDLSGRRVATIERSHLAAGTYSASWSGIDSKGAPVHAGMFFYRLHVGDEVRTVRGIKLQ